MDSVWLNGKIVNREAAVVSVFDHGLVTGDGVFETIGVYEGVAFALDRHLERLTRSSVGIGIGVPELEIIKQGVEDLLLANRCVNAKIRITLTGGESVLGSDRIGSPPTVVIATGPRQSAPPTAKVWVAPWPRNERSILAGLKTISYVENVAALAWAQDKGADEVIFANTLGNLCEGSGSNIFVVFDRQLYTPPLSSGALGGITRELIVENLGAKEQDFPVEVLFEGDIEECFLSSSVREAQGISHIDGVECKAPLGPVTMEIEREFTKLISRDLQRR